MFFVWSVLYALGSGLLSESVRLTPNDLAVKLRQLGVLDWDIPSIVCVAHTSSGLETNYKHFDDKLWKVNIYGIFGIPEALLEQEPCKFLTEKGALDDSIEDDVSCLMKMIEGSGYFQGPRIENLQHFSPSANLSECFDWWSTLPPFVKDWNGTNECVNGTSEFTPETLENETFVIEELVSLGSASVFLLGIGIVLLVAVSILFYLLLVQMRNRNAMLNSQSNRFYQADNHSILLNEYSVEE